ncbi:hypothetical protein GOP47_0028729 [Adiantum capillus-veneris]|nr:hypothetical protein GOP47_0028232 [Adiantum capillus-veneris]KAI5056911.1 hypothetical protein GOP47_0028729 [Adiantum capillus-veneris]
MMQASLYPSPSSSTATTTTTVARAFPSSLCKRRPSSSPSRICRRSEWLFSASKSSCLSFSWQKFSACRASPAVVCKVPNITQDSFPDEVLKSECPVLVGFCADWCGPCKLIGPVIDSVAKDFNGSLKAVKIDVDTSPNLVKEYDVYGLPTLIVFKDGKEVPNSRKEGAMNAKKLKALLDEVLSTTASP